MEIIAKIYRKSWVESIAVSFFGGDFPTRLIDIDRLYPKKRYFRSPCSGQRSAAERGEPAIRSNTRALREVSCCSIALIGALFGR